MRRLETTFLGRCAATFLEMQGIDRAMAIAAQAFTALIPLLILVSALAPVGSTNVVSDAVIHRFRLTGDAASVVRTVFDHPSDASTGVLSILLLLFSAVSFTRRVQRMYLQAWRLEPRPGVRGSVNAATGLAALVLEIALLSFVRSIFRSLSLTETLSWPTSILASLVLWTVVPWLLMDRRIPWQRLVPAGALTALGTTIYGIATAIYMPHLMESYSRRYGLFGVTLTLVSWLLCISFIVIAATVVASEFDRSQQPWARRLRSRLRLDRFEEPGVGS